MGSVTRKGRQWLGFRGVKKRRFQCKFFLGELSEFATFASMPKATCVTAAFSFVGRATDRISKPTTSPFSLTEGIDEETWMYHLRRGDYSHWFRKSVKDNYLADHAERIEQRTDLEPVETCNLIRSLIESRYTLPE